MSGPTVRIIRESKTRHSIKITEGVGHDSPETSTLGKGRTMAQARRRALRNLHRMIREIEAMA